MGADIYNEEFFKRINEEIEELDKFLEDLYEIELYQDASLHNLNNQIKEEDNEKEN